MRHKHTIGTNDEIQNSCIDEDKETGKCQDTNTFPVALEVLKNNYKTRIRNNQEKLDFLEDNLNYLEKFVKNTDEKLGGGNQDNPGNQDNTILDDENTIKEIIEQFTYLTKTPDFITKIKDFLEKKNIFKTVSTTNTDKNMNFEIKYIDNDMFVLNSDSDSDDKLKNKYYFQIDYYVSQAQFEEFKIQLNQLNELKKNYQDLILIFESAITEFRKKKTNLEKLINTYFKNSLSTKRETLNKFDDFIKNITKNVNNIKDIPKDLIDFLQVKKSRIQTSLIQKSFPHFESLDKIEFSKLNIDDVHSPDSETETVKIEEHQKNKPLKIISIKDDNNKTFTLKFTKKEKSSDIYIYTYMMKNSENSNYNHELNVTLKNKEVTVDNTYKIENIQAKLDTDIKIPPDKKGGAPKNTVEPLFTNSDQAVVPNQSPELPQTEGGGGENMGHWRGDEKQEVVSAQVKKSSTNSVQAVNPNQLPQIKGLNEVFNNLQKKIEYVIKQKIRDGVDVSGVKSKDIEKGDVGDDIIETLVLDYERKKQNVKSMDEKERIDREFLEKVNGLGLNLNEIFKVNLMDKFYFILYSLVLHIITYSIIEILIMSSNLNSLVSIMGIYSFLYVLLIILTLGIIHIYGYRGKVFLNYLNLDHNFYNIIGHFIIVAIFFGIILILSQYINTANIENEDERVKMLYRIEIITGVMFTFTTMFILIL